MKITKEELLKSVSRTLGLSTPAEFVEEINRILGTRHHIEDIEFNKQEE